MGIYTYFFFKLSDLSSEQRLLLSEKPIELHAWAFGTAGPRFKVFTTAGVTRDPFEKVADAAQVHRYTGITPRVSLHIPWDETPDFGALREYAKEQGVALGTINSNVFQDDDYKFGSLTNSDPKVRQKAIDAHLHCIDVMN